MDRPDPAEFRRLVLAELPAVHRMSVHLCRSRELADDLVQETYLRAFKSAGTFRTTELGPRPWLFKILHNAWRTRMSKQKSAAALVGEELAEQAAAPELPPLLLDWEQVDERLKRAVDDLHETYREALLLWAVEGLKYREIADVTGIPIGTVMSRLFRARQLLSAALSDLAADYGLAGRAGSPAPAIQSDG